jgi:CRP-like cAMP-binding protein
MGSYERGINEKVKKGTPLPEKLDISVVKYFWQASPLTGTRRDTVPKFLRSIDVLKNFSDNELRLLAKYLHMRTFDNGEEVFEQGDLGVGFYFIYSGHVDVIVDQKKHDQIEDQVGHTNDSKLILSLERFDYFGELALLQDHSARNATVVARESCILLGVFKPDVEELINYYPIVAAKLLQSVSLIVANRLHSLTKEARLLKYKLSQLEKEKEELVERRKQESENSND